MQKKTVVISLGGSLIVPDQMNMQFLHQFVAVIRKHYRTHKFVIVCGGGSIARKYIAILKAEGKSRNELAKAGIRATRMNAQFMMQLFSKKEVNNTLPHNIKQVKSHLAKNNVVMCGALRFDPHSTTDGTAAKIAHALKTIFINMTDVDGLFDKNPKKFPHAKFIEHISWDDFEAMALKIKFKPGQNFVLDQNAATLIRKEKIPTYIIGKDVSQLSRVLNQKTYKGTLITC